MALDFVDVQLLTPASRPWCRPWEVRIMPCLVGRCQSDISWFRRSRPRHGPSAGVWWRRSSLFKPTLVDEHVPAPFSRSCVRPNVAALSRERNTRSFAASMMLQYSPRGLQATEPERCMGSPKAVGVPKLAMSSLVRSMVHVPCWILKFPDAVMRSRWCKSTDVKVFKHT